MAPARLLATVPAVVLAAWLLAPAPVPAFDLLGGELGLAQRHARLFNNFADPSANDNLSPHPNFPGQTGATVAVWKASVEWGSELHGDGAGDPLQPGDLGSGGANFDFAFQGLGVGVGSTNGNTHSAISGSSGAFVAFTETPIADGWRIRYYEAWTWSDGPGAPLPNELDLQGIATHEAGHALGLGHSGAPGSVMTPFVIPGDTLRDLGADDVAGLQAIYGAKSPDKPHVEDVFLTAGGLVVITGESFTATGNEVWFPYGAPTSGPALTVAGVDATAGGTLIQLALPPGAGSGDVLVKKAGTGHAALSNAHPFESGGLPPSCDVSPFGTTLGGANVAELSSATAPVVGGTVVLDLGGFAGSGVALLALASQAAELAGLGGTVLISPTHLVASFAVAITAGTGSQGVPVPSDPALAGALVFAQAGMPDPAQPAGVALTHGVAIAVCP